MVENDGKRLSARSREQEAANREPSMNALLRRLGLQRAAPAGPAAAASDPASFQENALRQSPLRERIYADFSDIERSIYLASRVNLCGSPEAVVTLVRAVHHVIDRGIPGALVECGVYMGGNIEAMIRALQSRGVGDREIYLYDTFAGMPKPSDRDDGELGGVALWEAHRTERDGDNGSDWMRAGIELVRQRLEPLGYPGQHLRFVKGMVEDTIPAVAPDRIAILRLDTDFYASTRHELDHLYPRLSPGGILIIDDYGAFPGSRMATDEYAAEHRLDWFMHRVDAHVRLVVKPR
jgi:hypothetical protein